MLESDHLMCVSSSAMGNQHHHGAHICPGENRVHDVDSNHKAEEDQGADQSAQHHKGKGAFNSICWIQEGLAETGAARNPSAPAIQNLSALFSENIDRERYLLRFLELSDPDCQGLVSDTMEKSHLFSQD